MNTKDRINAIADALETASKQARLLAGELDKGITITTASIGKAMRDNQRSYLRKAGTMPTKDDLSHL